MTHRLHQLLWHHWWSELWGGGLRIDYGVVTWCCCGAVYATLPPPWTTYPGADDQCGKRRPDDGSWG